jgi:hypothetical protein
VDKMLVFAMAVVSCTHVASKRICMAAFLSMHVVSKHAVDPL